MPTIAHISDLHLQSTVPARQAQVEPILKAINERKPDLVVISGDVTDDGWDSIEELKWAKDWLGERIAGEWFAVPGNHDVGNFVSQTVGTIKLIRVEHWHASFDQATTFQFDYYFNPDAKILGWHIQGINSMLFGSGFQSEQEQVDLMSKMSKYVDAAMPKGIPTILITHSPLFIEQVHEESNPDANYWLGATDPRKAIWKILGLASVKLVCSGHVHQTRLTEVDGVMIAWAPPASGTWVHAPGLPNPPMPEKTGFLLHHLGDDGSVRSELVECAPMLKLYRHQP